jgi:phosphate-selective porin
VGVANRPRARLGALLALSLSGWAWGIAEAGAAEDSHEEGPKLEAWPPSIESGDGRHGLRLTGRLHLDGRGDLTGDRFSSGVVDRRARIGVRGHAFDRVTVDVAVQSSLGTFSFENAYLELKLHDRLRLRVGQMLRPFSLQRGTTSNALVHPERAVAVEKFAEFRDVGVLLELDVIDALELQVGVFEGTNALDFDQPPDLAVRARAEPRSALLFDIGYRWSPPTSRGFLPADALTSGGQLAPVLRYDRDRAWRDGSLHAVSSGARVVVGPVMMHAEALFERIERTTISGRGVGNLTEGGGVFDVSWAITGERQLEEELEPSRPLRSGGGTGAWQISARYQILFADPDSLDAGVASGAQVMHGAAGSLVWTPVPHLRWMVSYDYSRLEGIVGPGFGANVHALITRLDFHF